MVSGKKLQGSTNPVREEETIQTVFLTMAPSCSEYELMKWARMCPLFVVGAWWMVPVYSPFWVSPAIVGTGPTGRKRAVLRDQKQTRKKISGLAVLERWTFALGIDGMVGAAPDGQRHLRCVCVGVCVCVCTGCEWTPGNTSIEYWNNGKNYPFINRKNIGFYMNL